MEADASNLASPQDAERVALSRTIAAAGAGEIEHEIALAVAQPRTLGTPDPFGLSAALERANPAKWRQLAPHWEEELGRIQVRPRVLVRIPRVGLITG